VGFEDRLTIATPEGVDVDLVLAGLGSRAIARLLDFAIQVGAIIALVVATALAGGNGYVAAVVAVLVFLVLFGYDVAFEMLAGGRTIGKRANGLRVVGSRGQPVDLLASIIRNLMRIVDLMPLYPVGIVAVIATSRNQRLGDLAAGTLVVREVPGSRDVTEATLWMGRPTVPAEAVAGWDVSAVGTEEVVAIRHFLARRLTLPPAIRAQLGWELAVTIGARVAGAPDGVHPEYLLEGVVVAKELRP